MSQPWLRTGIGADAHRLVPGRAMWLAGLHFPDESQGLEGHSDGDVAAHAACDAVLSAAGLGDLGAMFGTADPAWADGAGVDFLRAVADRVRAAGLAIGNIAVRVLSEAAGAPVSVTATTTDGLGFTGRGEGVAAVATALVYGVSAGSELRSAEG